MTTESAKERAKKEAEEAMDKFKDFLTDMAFTDRAIRLNNISNIVDAIHLVGMQLMDDLDSLQQDGDISKNERRDITRKFRLMLSKQIEYARIAPYK